MATDNSLFVNHVLLSRCKYKLFLVIGLELSEDFFCFIVNLGFADMMRWLNFAKNIN